MTADPATTRRLAIGGLVGLTITYLWLAAAPATGGSRIVLATAGGSPDWLLGPLRKFGAGYLAGPHAGWSYYAGLLLAVALWALVIACARGVSLRTIAVVVAGLHLLFLLAPPLLSQDVFSYIAYARLGVVHHLNPYAHAPAAIPGDNVYPFAGSKHASDVYGPYFTLLTYPLAKVSVPTAFWTLKAVACASSLGVVALVAKSARKLGRDPRPAIAIVGLGPVTLVHVVGGAHNEALTLLVTMASVLLFLRAREPLGGFVAATGAAVKASAALPLPFMLIAARDRLRLFGGMLAAGVLAVVVALIAFGGDALDGFNLISSNQDRTSKFSSPHKIVDAADALIGHVNRARLADDVRVLLVVLLAMLVVWLLRETWRRRETEPAFWLRATGWATLGVLLASAWLVPWYLLWLLPFAALASDRRLTVATTAFTAYALAIAIPF